MVILAIPGHNQAEGAELSGLDPKEDHLQGQSLKKKAA